MPGFFVENFGCRATQADGAALERQFEEQGLSRASSPKNASVVVLNTCTVTTGADQDARAAIRRVRRQNPEARIVVTGCYAQRAPEEIAALPGVDVVVGNSHKHQLAEIVVRKSLSSQETAAGFNSLSQVIENPVLEEENALGESALKGHAFRRAVGGRVKKPALAAEAFNPQGLKALSYFGPLSARMNPCPFALPPSRKVEFSHRL